MIAESRTVSFLNAFQALVMGCHVPTLVRNNRAWTQFPSTGRSPQRVSVPTCADFSAGVTANGSMPRYGVVMKIE